MDWLWTILWLIGAIVALIGAFGMFCIFGGMRSKRKAMDMAKWAESTYSTLKAGLPNTPEIDIIESMSVMGGTWRMPFTLDQRPPMFAVERLLSSPDEITKAALKVLYERVNGLCYLIAFAHYPFENESIVKGARVAMFMDFFQFTSHVDNSLEAVGFPKVTKVERSKLMQSLGTIAGWDLVSALELVEKS